MAYFSGSVFSHVLDLSTSLSVLLPNDRLQRPEGGFPVLYLLHGIFENHTAWMQNTTVARYAEKYGMAVVMPEAPRSFYTDMRYGRRYFTYISEELPTLCRELFGLAARREKTFVAGVSMGGYGALKCGLRRPDVFAACAGLSAPTDLARRAKDYKNRPDMCNVFGDPPVVGKEDDLFALAEKAGTLPKGERPSVLMCCGTEDTRLAENRRLKEALLQNGIPLSYAEQPGGHNWDYWERILPQMFEFFNNIYDFGGEMLS